MKFRYIIEPHILNFKKPAGTSRGVFTVHKIWYIFLYPTDLKPLDLINGTATFGIGECAPLPGLSCDDLPEDQYLSILNSALISLCKTNEIEYEKLMPYPSILFGIETALRSYWENTIKLWNTPFTKGHLGIQINGLIWMDTYESMLNQIRNKLKEGFRCLKLKIGSIDFHDELELLKGIRSQFSSEELTLRLDANGAFRHNEALNKLNELARYDIHSLEQPIKAGNLEAMASVIKDSPIPIALDEELIGFHNIYEKDKLLSLLKPHYIILKPSLHGGLRGCEDWISIAKKYKIKWWVTSALESNIGLNAIAQWYSLYQIKQDSNNVTPQGLGTGGLYKNNLAMPLSLKSDILSFEPTNIDDCKRGSCRILLSRINLMNTQFSITIDGRLYTFEDLKKNKPNFAFLNDFGMELYTFLMEWWNDSPYMEVKTSGSTGKPKIIELEKWRMINSALITCNFLKLEAGMKALLCLPLSSIAGIMMVVRAIVCKLDLYFTLPSGNPLSESISSTFSNLDFAAFTPMQLFNITNEENGARNKSEQNKIILENIKKVIVGGATISRQLRKTLQNYSNEIYSTYGMTETISHIAMQRLNGIDASLAYRALDSVNLSICHDNCLQIDAPLLSKKILKTNDIAEISSNGTFKILGRKDNIINTGGIKIQIEELEYKLASFIKAPFAITSVKDIKFTDAIVLLIEDEGSKNILDFSISKLTGYEKPKYTIYVKTLPITKTGKIDRIKCKELANKYLSMSENEN